jgi:ribosome-associated protein
LTNQQTQKEMLQFMEQQPTKNTVTAADLIVDDGTMDLVECIVKAADGRKADNIVAWVVQHVTTLTSVVVVVSGNSRPQNQAIGNAISQAVVDANLLPQAGDSSESSSAPVANGPTIEGTAESGWMVLDYGSVMVHIMTPKSRLFYNVEGQWKDSAVSIDLSAILIPNSLPAAAAAAAASGTGMQQPPPAIVPEEDDPFWS